MAGARHVAAACLLTALEIAAIEAETRAHAFDGNAVRRDKSLSERVGLSRLGVHVVSIEPGYRASARHRHLFADECVWVLSGSGRAVVGDEAFAVRAGDFLGYPANGLAHALEAAGDVPLVCLVVGERLAQDVIDYPDAGKRLVRDNDGTLTIRDLPPIAALKSND